MKLYKDGKKSHGSELAKILAGEFELTSEERDQMKPSGGQTLFENRGGWAAFDMKKTGLANRENATVSITDEGKKH